MANLQRVIKTWGNAAGTPCRREPVRIGRWLPWLLAVFLLPASLGAEARPVLSTDNPTAFFTNAAIRLLIHAGYAIGAPGSTSNLLIAATEGGLPVTKLHIPISPVNFYTPSVHRLLQLAANVHDATTNRADLNPGAASPYPYLPSVFRPLFYEGPCDQAGRRQVFIVGYDQLNAQDLNPNGPLLGRTTPHDLSDGDDMQRLGQVQPRHMVYNVPLVIGARKGFPSFDEFTLHTQIQAARQLIYHRRGTSADGPINEIDPVYLLAVTNVVGLQAWNSYTNAFTRPLQMQVWPDISVLLTNTMTGKLLNPAPQRYPPIPTNIAAITFWPGYESFYSTDSFITPLGSPTATYVFMPTNSVYSSANDQFVVDGAPDRTPGLTNFTVPKFQLTLKTRLRYALMDTAANRLVDYVNLAASKSVDLTDALMHNSDGSPGCGSTYSPVYSRGGMWCTNRNLGPGGDPNMRFGIRLQIDASKGALALPPYVWADSLPDPIYGADHAKAVARFKAQFFYDPIYPKVNTFHAPFQPIRNIHLVTLWQANDPLVNYTVGDLKNPGALTNAYYLDQLPLMRTLPPTPFGQVNSRYEPWGGNPITGSLTTTSTDLTVKDPIAGYSGTSDDWDFPAGPLPCLSWLGRVHRGTPWQTLYLKSSAGHLPAWVYYTGNSQLVTNAGQLSTTLVPLGGVINDACFTHPTNDWRIASLLVSLLNTNDPRQLLSANEPSLPRWLGAMDGIAVLTNIAPGQFSTAIMSSNSPQAATIAASLSALRGNQPRQYFQSIGDIFAAPELTVASPWLDTSLGPQARITDAAYEAVPAQLLPLLRADSVGAVLQNGDTLQVQFSGIDGLAYAVQASSNLEDWATLGTNYPAYGAFNFVVTPPLGVPCRFYRSVLLP